MSCTEVEPITTGLNTSMRNLTKFTEREQYQTKTLVLHRGQHLDSTLFYLKKGWNLRFEQGPLLRSTTIEFHTNHPTEGREFIRENYQVLKWNTNTPDCSPYFVCLRLHMPGAFHYYITERNCTEKLGSGYFIVEPVLSFTGDDFVPLDSIRCQTVLTKSLGKFNDWEKRLQVSKECGYNMVHFTPIQELGGSNSSYSLKDQLKLNPAFDSENFKPDFDDVLRLTEKMRKEWKVLSLGDVVLNHTANESPWLQSHPESTYNMITSPHLIPAAILDGHLHVFSKNVSLGKFTNMGIPTEVYTESHLQAIRRYLQDDLVPRLRLHEFYMTNIENLCDEFRKISSQRMPSDGGKRRENLRLLRDCLSRRNNAKVDMEIAVDIFNTRRDDITDEEKRLQVCVEDFKSRLYELNEDSRQEVNNHLSSAIDNCIASMKYFRVQDDGPKIREVSLEHPLVPRYFTGSFDDEDTVEDEILGQNGKFVMAHNGWVMNADPLKNFAESDSNVYLRRELIAWGDSVKLRYGKSDNDCPFLWHHMRAYVEISARLFDGLRLDNCHSTPLHVAEYLLDVARKIKPNLYVAAELFTNSDVVDNIFANRLGISAMIRETSTAYNSHELGRLVHRYGGEPVGSFFDRKSIPIRPSIAHALLYDATHDNPSPIEKKNVFYLIPVASLVSMACCATGSSRGFDELVPHQVDVVTEKRLYPSWSDACTHDERFVGPKTGIIPVKKVLNEIHRQLDEEGFKEVYVDQMNEDIVAVTRHSPTTHESVVLVAHTAFNPPNSENLKPFVKNLKVEAEFSGILLEAKLMPITEKKPLKRFVPNNEYINGLTDYKVHMKVNIKLEESETVRQVDNQENKVSEFEFIDFPPGSIIIIRFKPHREVEKDLNALKVIADEYLNSRLEAEKNKMRFANYDLEALNRALYSCSAEGLENGMGPYDVPGCGSLIYCGIQGFESFLWELRRRNDLGHPFCENLRQGPWMLDYIVRQLKNANHSTRADVEDLIDLLRNIPKYLLPKYFDIVVSSICCLLESKALSWMSLFVRNGSKFIQHLALGSVQCLAHVKSAPLPPYSKDVSKVRPYETTMCAGLPHFSTGYTRSWGRDTFISLKGLLLLTGRHEEARNHILSYAACLRHGLIPNLLDRGVNARYNCRDAVWWWLYAIMSYIQMTPQGHLILKEFVSRLYPTDDSLPLKPGQAEQSLQDIIQETLNVHFQGLSFRERNAGPKIDAHMTDEGFNNHIGVDRETGFVFGGNEFNCGTWMDKMGSDMKTGTRGKPATPRDGSAIEIVALSKAVVRELHLLSEKGVYPYKGVEKRDGKGMKCIWTFKEWENKISENFEKFFWIPEVIPSWERKPEMVHRRNIYKDSFGSTQPWADYQLRPNFLIALTVAPEMMNPENAWKAIQTAEKVLLGPLGIKTLDPEDWNYNGFYNNNDDSNNPKTAHGFNYHQGPEWLWLVGFFLRAKLIFAEKIGQDELMKAKHETLSYLGNHYDVLFNSPWRGLPELTNANGQFCSDSCRVQAWSMACLLEALYQLYHNEYKQV